MKRRNTFPLDDLLEPGVNVTFENTDRATRYAPNNPRPHVNDSVNGVELTNYQATLNSTAETYNKDLVIPGDVAGSPLVDKILANPQFGIRMPDGGPPLSTTQIQTISTWVEEGALNN